MKAMVNTEYGSPDVLHLSEIPKPIPGDNDVLIKVEAAGVNPADWHLLHGEPFPVRLDAGLRKPKNPVLGADVAGRVAAIGRNVSGFQVDQAVYGDLSASGRGSFAEYVVAPAGAVAAMPDNISFAQAAAVPMAGVTALQGLRDHGQIAAGQKVLINGASGGVGTFAVQLAKAFDTEVTAVCSRRKADLVRSIGADVIIDYTEEDFTRSGTQYDLIFDTVANHSVSDYRRVLRPGGRFVTTNFLPALAFLGPWLSFTGGPAMINMMAKPQQADLVSLATLLASGQLTPVLDQQYALAELPDALRYVNQGRARGKVVIAIGEAEHPRNNVEAAGRDSLADEAPRSR